MLFDGPLPSGISPRPSQIAQRPPSERTLSTPVLFIGGCSGPITHSPSKIHSPTSFCSHACSFCGSAFIILSHVGPMVARVCIAARRLLVQRVMART